MIFITLQTGDYEDRKVTFSLSEKDMSVFRLLGILPHNTKIKRIDLVKFAAEVLRIEKEWSKVK